VTVKEIIVKYLKDNGYEGLCYPDIECGCSIDDLPPCDSLNENCETAQKVECKDCDEQVCDYRGEVGECFRPKE